MKFINYEIVALRTHNFSVSDIAELNSILVENGSSRATSIAYKFNNEQVRKSAYSEVKIDTLDNSLMLLCSKFSASLKNEDKAVYTLDNFTQANKRNSKCIYPIWISHLRINGVSKYMVVLRPASRLSLERSSDYMHI